MNRGRDTFGNPDDYQLRWLTTKDCKSLFDLLQIKASHSSVKLHQLMQILCIQHSAGQSSMSHVITIGETDRGISTEVYHVWLVDAEPSQDLAPTGPVCLCPFIGDDRKWPERPDSVTIDAARDIPRLLRYHIVEPPRRRR